MKTNETTRDEEEKKNHLDTKEQGGEEKKMNVVETLRANVSMLETFALASPERREAGAARIAGQVIRTTVAAKRSGWTAADMMTFLREMDSRAKDEKQNAAATATMETLVAAVDKVGDTGAPAEEDVQMGEGGNGDAKTASGGQISPEVEIYALLITIMFLIHKKEFNVAVDVSTQAVRRVQQLNRRSLDALAAKIYFYYSWSHECVGKLDSIRGTLLALHRTASLRRDAASLETLLNLLLRNYLHYNLYDQAEKFRAKSQRPDSHSNQQYCRYLFYLGKIRAAMLEYSEAKDCLQQAVRKSPQPAHGFRVVASKWLVIVRLLLGDVPERTLFRAKGYRKPLEPYLELTQAVRAGDLTVFAEVTKQHADVFERDGTRNLIVRLRHNVIRAGLRNIHLAYSKISLADVASRLGLSEVEDTEYIVAKAIRDGGISASIDHDAGCMLSNAKLDIYDTSEPLEAFHDRICFCLNIHNEAVKAMRYPPDAHKDDLESAEERRERLAQEQELAAVIAEDADEDMI